MKSTFLILATDERSLDRPFVIDIHIRREGEILYSAPSAQISAAAAPWENQIKNGDMVVPAASARACPPMGLFLFFFTAHLNSTLDRILPDKA